MIHLAIHFVAAFCTPPVAGPVEKSEPDRSHIPIAFIVFGVVCVALEIAEILWPPLSATLAALDASIAPQL